MKTNYYQLWQNSAYGKEFFNTEINILKKNLKNIFGFHLLQIGAEKLDYLENLEDKLKINHRIVLSDNLSDKMPQNSSFKSTLYTKDNEIPLASETIDAVLISHGLEQSTDPHGLLREVDRILLPEGYMIILGFNPWSFWGLRKGLTVKKTSDMELDFPWDTKGKWFSSARICDWLSLLNYKIDFKKHYFYRPCIDNPNILKYTAGFEMVGKIIPLGAAGFCIVAIKKQVAFELLRPKWQSELSLVGKANYIEPSMRIKDN